MRSASNKNTGGLQARPGANKPFMTEYKLAFRDPSMSKGGKGYGNVVGTIPKQQRRKKTGAASGAGTLAKEVAPPLPAKEEPKPAVEKPPFPGGLGGIQLPFLENRETSNQRKHVSKRDIW
ncbi:hypothetical protein HDU96_009164, partial [Phlyctochytrium bullatum]